MRLTPIIYNQTRTPLMYRVICMYLSDNTHDRLGTNDYFWEKSAQCGYPGAELVLTYTQPFLHRIRKSFVLGAIIEVGNCPDLSESKSLAGIKEAHRQLAGACQDSHVPMPGNEAGFPGDLQESVPNFSDSHLHKTPNGPER
jgi:hypothetical protein